LIGDCRNYVGFHVFVPYGTVRGDFCYPFFDQIIEKRDEALSRFGLFREWCDEVGDHDGFDFARYDFWQYISGDCVGSAVSYVCDAFVFAV